VTLVRRQGPIVEVEAVAIKGRHAILFVHGEGNWWGNKIRRRRIKTKID